MPAVRGSRASNSSTAAALAAAAAAANSSSNGTNNDLLIDPSLNDMNTGMMIPPPGMQAGPPPGGQQMMMPSQAGPGDDGDNRTRNAKAQRRHREKRKAHLKALEESVQLLTLQLEDARRQLAQSAYYNSQRPGGPPMSPQSKDFAQLQAENAYLRDENADLRRQLYSYRMNYGNPSTPADGNKDGSGAQGNGQQQAGNAGAGGSNGPQSWEVKPDQGFVYGQAGGMSPRRSGDASVQSTAENGPSSASSSSGNYQPIEHFTPIHQRSRSRNMSQTASPAQAGPAASPYMNNEVRPIDSRYSATGIRQYDPPTPVFPAPPNVPRYDVPHHYTPRPGEGSVSWPSESGPPPFSGYPLNFGENTPGDEWRAGDA